MGLAGEALNRALRVVSCLGFRVGPLIWARKRVPLIYTLLKLRAHTSEPFKGGKGPYQGPMKQALDARPRRNLGITRVPVCVKGVIREPKPKKKGNKCLLWVLGFMAWGSGVDLIRIQVEACKVWDFRLRLSHP